MPYPNYNYGYYPQNYVPQQIQNGGLISVRSENEARNYPIAPGNSITFKDESQPYVYVKTMGFSQLDRPTFEKFRLIKEEAIENAQNANIPRQDNQTVDLSAYALKADLDELRQEFEMLKEDKDE